MVNLDDLGTSYHTELGLLSEKQLRVRERPAQRARLQRVYSDLLAGEEIFLGVFDDTRTRVSPYALAKGADPADTRLYDSSDDYILFNLMMRRDTDYTDNVLVLPPIDALVTSIDTLINGTRNVQTNTLFVVPTPKTTQLLDMYVTQVASMYDLDLLKDTKVPADYMNDS